MIFMFISLNTLSNKLQSTELYCL